MEQARADTDADHALLNAMPDYITFGPMLKATPGEEAGERVLYIEASNEDRDYQDEVVLQKALKESAPYFLRHGNIDLSHYTILGPKSGVPNFMEYEIGKPTDVSVDDGRTFVKAQLYRGDSPMAHNANMVWESLTKQSPPSRWFPSVGGAVLAKGIRVDPETGERIGVISKVRWNNIALDRQPVNRTVPEVSTVPLGVFAKSLGGFVVKALVADYGTDTADLTGGAALRRQSLAGRVVSYFDFRNRMADALRAGRARPRSRDITKYTRDRFGLPADKAAEWVERFLRDLSRDRAAHKES